MCVCVFCWKMQQQHNGDVLGLRNVFGKVDRYATWKIWNIDFMDGHKNNWRSHDGNGMRCVVV